MIYKSKGGTTLAFTKRQLQENMNHLASLENPERSANDNKNNQLLCIAMSSYYLLYR